MTKVMNNNRRDFLKVSGMTAALVASQGSLFAKTNVMSVENGKENYPNTNYTESMYRNEFAFTYGKKEEHGFAYHCVNCQGNCAWEVWSHNGVVTRKTNHLVTQLSMQKFLTLILADVIKGFSTLRLCTKKTVSSIL